MSTSESRKPVDPAAPSERFLFETSFDAEALAAQDEPPEPTFGAADLEAARQAAYAEGEAAGRQDAINSIEKQLLNGLGRLVEQMTALSDDQARYQDRLTARSVELALKAIRKMFPALAERDGLVEIEAVLADCLREARAEPRIVFRIAGALVEPMQERVDALAAAAGHEGTVAVLADDSLGPADCRVEWAEGGAERVVQHMWQEFEAATQRIFQSADDQPVDDAPHLDGHIDEAAPETPDDAPEAAADQPPSPDDSLEVHDDAPGPASELNGHANGFASAPAAPNAPPSITPAEGASGAVDHAPTDIPTPDTDPQQDTPNAS